MWEEILASRNPNPISPLLCLDPGETTGWACFIEGRLKEYGQSDSVNLRGGSITRLLDEHKPKEIVCEDYRVYAHRLAQHTHSDLFTPRLIGMVEFACEQRRLTLHKQMASAAKGFVSDKRLKDWNMYTPQRHARDAIRHGIYFLLFGKG